MHGISHLVPMRLLPLWKKTCCKRGWHLFDEVVSFGSTEPHYLSCDACNLMVVISRIETKYVK